MSPVVFVSYSRPDLKAARGLVLLLKAAGFATWFDQHNLLGGQSWKDTIEDAINEASLFLTCLSNHSVNATGYFQKENRLALSGAELRPPKTIYIIPIRLQPCQIPTAVNHLQVVDLFVPGKTYGLLSAIGAALDLGARAPTEAHDRLEALIAEMQQG